MHPCLAAQILADLCKIIAHVCFCARNKVQFDLPGDKPSLKAESDLAPDVHLRAGASDRVSERQGAFVPGDTVFRSEKILYVPAVKGPETVVRIQMVQAPAEVGFQNGKVVPAEEVVGGRKCRTL